MLKSFQNLRDKAKNDLKVKTVGLQCSRCRIDLQTCKGHLHIEIISYINPPRVKTFLDFNKKLRFLDYQ